MNRYGWISNSFLPYFSSLSMLLLLRRLFFVFISINFNWKSYLTKMHIALHENGMGGTTTATKVKMMEIYAIHWMILVINAFLKWFYWRWIIIYLNFEFKFINWWKSFQNGWSLGLVLRVRIFLLIYRSFEFRHWMLMKIQVLEWKFHDEQKQSSNTMILFWK